jgi:sigma-B regulation protein RsbU (phosphoserine phosphatase)
MNPVLQSIISAAVGATAATKGWVLALEDADLRVVAALGEGAGDLMGATVPSGSGTSGFVASSGQPMALAPRGDDARMAEGVTALLSTRPTSILSVPCGNDDVVGVLELVDKVGGGSFSFDDVEMATLLAGVAGAALQAPGGEVMARPPAEIGAELGRLASADPEAYARVATVVDALLARG